MNWRAISAILENEMLRQIKKKLVTSQKNHNNASAQNCETQNESKQSREKLSLCKFRFKFVTE